MLSSLDLYPPGDMQRQEMNDNKWFDSWAYTPKLVFFKK